MSTSCPNKKGTFLIQGFAFLADPRYDSFSFQADAEQQLELHGPRLLAAALVPLTMIFSRWVATQTFLLIFTPKIGEMIQFDEHMFQLG